MTYTPAELNLPPLSSIEDFARLSGYGPGLIRRCTRSATAVNGWPPLSAVTMPDGQKRITAPDGARWINLILKAAS